MQSDPKPSETFSQDRFIEPFISLSPIFMTVSAEVLLPRIPSTQRFPSGGRAGIAGAASFFTSFVLGLRLGGEGGERNGERQERKSCGGANHDVLHLWLKISDGK